MSTSQTTQQTPAPTSGSQADADAPNGILPDEVLNDAEAWREKQITEKLREVGYSPYPETDAVPTDLYRDRLTRWLNRRAGLAFVAEQTPHETHVTVTFELPFGGLFEQEFARPDAQYETRVTYDEFLDVAGVPLDKLDRLESVEVPIRERNDEWEVNATGSTTHTGWTGMHARRQKVAYLAFNRVVVMPVAIGLAFLGERTPSVIPIWLLIGILAALLVVGFYTDATGGVSNTDKLGWIADDD